MRGFKPSPRVWAKVNQAIVGENAADVLVTLISGLCSILVSSGACEDENHARAHLAAVILSPDTGNRAGSLAHRLPAEFATLDDGERLN